MFRWILGILGVLLLVVLLACVLFLPGSILTLGAGVVFGVVKGSIIVSAASTASARRLPRCSCAAAVRAARASMFSP